MIYILVCLSVCLSVDRQFVLPVYDVTASSPSSSIELLAMGERHRTDEAERSACMLPLRNLFSYELSIEVNNELDFLVFDWLRHTRTATSYITKVHHGPYCDVIYTMLSYSLSLEACTKGQ